MPKNFQRIEIVLEPEVFFRNQLALKIRVRHGVTETGVTELVEEDHFKCLFDLALEIGIAKLRRELQKTQ